ncbi:hypothetical protein Tco_1296835 [Tanacetum coccineum]
MLAINGAGFDWSYMTDDEVPKNMALMAFLDSKPEFQGYGPKTSKNVCKDILDEVWKSPDAPLVEELVSDAEKFEKKTIFPTNIEFVKQKKNQLGKQLSMMKCTDHKANCNFHQRERVNYTRVNYNYSAQQTHPSAYRNMVPRVVLMKNPLRTLNTARHVNTAHPKTIFHSARPMSQFSKIAPSRRPVQKKTTLTNRSFHQKVNTVKGKVNTVRPKAVNTARQKAINTARPSLAVVKAVRVNQVNPGHRMLGLETYQSNMFYLLDFEEFNGGYVTFGGGAKGGRIIGKGTLKTGKFDLEDVYFVKELQFNLFSVSQMCDKKNSVLFTDT